jgi:hypothetical protein
MKLYFSPGACSLSPHIVLREAGFEFTLEKVNLRNRQTASGVDYTTINPKGYVPALDLGNGELLTEGPAIVQYLADQAPESRLALDRFAGKIDALTGTQLGPLAILDFSIHQHLAVGDPLLRLASRATQTGGLQQLVKLDEFAFDGEADGHGGGLRCALGMFQERRIVSEPTQSANPLSPPIDLV